MKFSRRSRPLLVACAVLVGGLGSGIAAGTSSAADAQAAAGTDPAALANPFIGTTDGGNVTPAASYPFGMMQYGPDTAGTGSAAGGYDGTATEIKGFSTTALSGAGCSDFNDFPIMPYVGSVTTSPESSPSTYYSTYSDSKASPGYYSTFLNTAETRIQTTVSQYAGLAELTFPSSTESTVLVSPNAAQASTGTGGGGMGGGASAASFTVVNDHTIEASETGPDFCGASGSSYDIYLDITFDQPFTAHGSWDGSAVTAGASSVSGAESGVYLTFDTTSEQTVKARTAISYVSVAGAEKNLAAGAPNFDFSQMRASATAAWNGDLGKISVSGGTAAHLATFYTALYHTMIDPSTFSDADGKYIGYDDKIHTASGWTQLANFSGWDVYRDEVPLLAMIDPGIARDLAQSLVMDGKQGGAMPMWGAANHESGIMNGNPASIAVATIYAYGIRGFDTREALKLMLKAALVPGTEDQSYLATPGVAAELADGYVPIGDTDPVELSFTSGVAARTLEYATADSAVAAYAKALGDTADVATLEKEAQNWENEFNPETGFIEPRNSDGTFEAGFDPTSETDFAEGNAYTYTWEVPQNISALVAALGGKTATVARLDQYFTEVNGAEDSPYAAMTNEPSFGTAALYDWAGDPAGSQKVTREAEDLYTDASDGLAGNDDLGAMSSWYVLNALGIYSEIPGRAGFAVTGPLFTTARISLADGKAITIAAPGAGESAPYIQSASLDGKPLNATWLAWSDLDRGASLRFTMGTRATTWAARYTPPSDAASQAPGIGFVTSDAVSLTGGGSTTLAVGVQNVTSKPLTVTVTPADLPSGVTATPTPATLTIPAGQRQELTLSVSASTSATSGVFKLDVTSSSGATIPTESVTVTTSS